MPTDYDAWKLASPPEYYEPEATGTQTIHIERGPESLPAELAALVPEDETAELTVEVETDAVGIDWGLATHFVAGDGGRAFDKPLTPPIRVTLTDSEWQEAIDRRLEAMADEAEGGLYDTLEEAAGER